MARYVDVDLAIELTKRAAEEMGKEADARKVNDLIEILDNLPTADVAPVVHGKWIPIDQMVARCSECGYARYSNGSDLTGKALVHRALFKFCEHCGARMDG